MFSYYQLNDHSIIKRTKTTNKQRKRVCGHNIIIKIKTEQLPFVFVLTVSSMAFCSNLCLRLPATRIDVPSPTTFRCRKLFSVRCSADADFDPKLFRKNLTRSENYNRKGFGHKEETLKLMNREYTSMLRFFFPSQNNFAN